MCVCVCVCVCVCMCVCVCVCFPSMCVYNSCFIQRWLEFIYDGFFSFI